MGEDLGNLEKEDADLEVEQDGSALTGDAATEKE